MRIPLIAALAALILSGCASIRANPDEAEKAAELLAGGAELFCALGFGARQAARDKLTTAQFLAGLAANCLESPVPVPVKAAP